MSTPIKPGTTTNNSPGKVVNDSIIIYWGTYGPQDRRAYVILCFPSLVPPEKGKNALPANYRPTVLVSVVEKSVDIRLIKYIGKTLALDISKTESNVAQRTSELTTNPPIFGSGSKLPREIVYQCCPGYPKHMMPMYLGYLFYHQLNFGCWINIYQFLHETQFKLLQLALQYHQVDNFLFRNPASEKITN